MRQVVKVQIGNEELFAVIEDGELTGFKPVTINHLNKDVLGCVTYIVLIGNAITQTGKKDTDRQPGVKAAV